MRVSRQQVLHRTVRAHALGRLAKDPVEAVRRAAGIYATPPSIHLGLALRVRDYQPTMLDRELLERRTLVRTPAVRGSVYVLPVDWVSAALTLTLVKPLITILATRGVSEPAYAKLADRIEATLADGHKSSAEIQAALGKHLPDELAISGVLRRMSHEGRIVRTKVRGGAKSQSYEYARMSDWVDLPPRPSRAEALALLARPWVLANGPATIADLAWWAMVPQKDARPALAAIGAREVEVEGLPGPLFAISELLEDLAAAPVKDDSIHLLPLWDAYLMASTHRDRYLDPAHRPWVVDKMGNVTNVILRGGRVEGIWDVDGETLLYKPLAKLPKRALEAAARELAPVYEIGEMVEISDPPPLAQIGRNAFMSPLRQLVSAWKRA